MIVFSQWRESTTLREERVKTACRTARLVSSRHVSESKKKIKDPEENRFPNARAPQPGTLQAAADPKG